MEKRRAAGVVSGDALVGQVAGADVVIYDDMIASGETILRAAHAARRAGAQRIHVAAPHPVFQPSALQLFDADGPDTVYVSDSIGLAPPFTPLVGERLRICPAAPLLARAITQLA